MGSGGAWNRNDIEIHVAYIAHVWWRVSLTSSQSKPAKLPKRSNPLSSSSILSNIATSTSPKEETEGGRQKQIDRQEAYKQSYKDSERQRQMETEKDSNNILTVNHKPSP